MGQSELQEKRMRGYFIEATKEMIKSEGLKSISVRNIAERAGYSFATIYNYFRDVNTLVFLCVKDFQDECREHIANRTAKVPHGPKHIKTTCLAYIEYFVQYPGIFELFFIEKISAMSSGQKTAELIVSFLDQLCADEWAYCIDKKLFTQKEVSFMQQQLSVITSGLLLLYVNRRHPDTYTDFIKQANAQLDGVFNTHK